MIVRREMEWQERERERKIAQEMIWNIVNILGVFIRPAKLTFHGFLQLFLISCSNVK